MLIQIHPKLPMRDKRITTDYYKNQLGFELYGSDVFDEYLMLIIIIKSNIKSFFSLLLR